MHHPLAGSESGLLRYWRLDDASGAVLTDSSGQGNNGSLSGGARWVDSTAPLYP